MFPLSTRVLSPSVPGKLCSFHIVEVPCQLSINLIDTGFFFYWFLSWNRGRPWPSRGGYRTGFPLPGIWVLRLVPEWSSSAYRRYLDWFQTVRPCVVVHSTSGALLCTFSVVRNRFPDPVMCCLPIRMYHFPFDWSVAFSFPLVLLFQFVRRFFFSGVFLLRSLTLCRRLRLLSLP